MGWFALAHGGLLALIGLRFLWYYAPAEPATAWPYALMTYVGHLAALAYVPFLVLLGPAILVYPRPRLVIPAGVAIGSVALAFLLLDSLVFADNRYHLELVTLAMLAPATWGFFAVYAVLGAAIEGMLAGWIWARSSLPSKGRLWRRIALVLCGCFAVSHLVHAWAEAHYYVPVTGFTRYLPLYVPLRDRKVQARLGLLDRSRALDQNAVEAVRGLPQGELSYPVAPLRCDGPASALNVLLVVIDAMRADALAPDVAPRTWELAGTATRFDQHYSGGNSSRAGMFSLFYGLPATYWNAFASVARPPVLMDLFRQRDYQLGLFASAPVYLGVGLDRTAFSRVPNLRLETVSDRRGEAATDARTTDEWVQWLDRRDPSRPFFGFLYYNSAVVISPPDDYPPVRAVPPNAPARERSRDRYLSAVHFIDSLVGRVIDDLARRHLLDRTVVVVTSDHGMEFDENGLGFTGHGTSFSRYQMHVPLVVRWPGRPPGRVTRRTSHYDVAPTLVGPLFGCANPASDYSSGRDLYSDISWEWLSATGYASGFAVIEPDRVTIVYPASYEVRDRSYRLVPEPALPRARLADALREMSRFYR